MGVQFKNGLGVAQNNQVAIKWFTKAANAGYAKAWYNLGTAYREKLDFTNAYNAFSNGASQDPQSAYMKGYMLYKGFGCTQDYGQAALLFAKGAALGKPNCMYFYGLCLRNGYGVPENIDSARFWLTQAANLGYKMAKNELLTKDPENEGIASGTLAEKIKEAQSALPNNKVANQYQKVENKVAANEVTGTYTGYLLKYDWSGEYPIEANKLTVTLENNKDSLTGIWNEDDSLSLPIHAILSSRAIVFNQMKYSKTNHYSTKKPEMSVFKKATLQLDKIGDSVYLSGNIEEFIPSRNEPSKPLYLALVRTKAGSSSNEIVNDAPLRVYPNPFISSINIDFELKEACSVSTQLVSMDGKVVYDNPAGTLSAGSYTLPIQTQQITHGYYSLVLHYGNKIRTAKIVKL